MIKWFKEYISKTPHEELLKEWKEIEELDIDGIKVDEILQSYFGSFTFVNDSDPPTKIKLTIEQSTPNFVRGFLLYIFEPCL